MNDTRKVTDGLRHACLATLGFLNGQSILTKDQLQELLVDAVKATELAGPKCEVHCPDCGPVVVVADVTDHGEPISGPCPLCGDQLYFA